ncbi:MAG: biopolymer transporter ExbD [Planctomycetes bacterium]|nr:biopolymer transporter ExbD [Planctomycetota bacterium]
MAAGPATGKGAAHAAWVMNLLTDLAFNLLIFFVVCASSSKEQKGKPQQVPSSETDKKSADTKPQNVEVAMTRTTVSLNGTAVPLTELKGKLSALLAKKGKPEERIVEVKTAKDTPYAHWIKVTSAIEDAGGIVTLQVEVDREVIVK